MKISEIIFEWYKNNRRDLPWRETRDPYRIWLSEIILQQTRIAQGKDYYLRFIERFPDIESLAAAEDQEVMKLWQGLGYYSRARNLLFAARQVMTDLQGVFPTDYSGLLKLKGVGKYTAAAIASIAYNEAVPVLDGNVYRVISRLFAVKEAVNSPAGQKVFFYFAGELLNPDHPGDHNQAMMEFGALQCIPVNPDCGACPLSSMCMAYRDGIVSDFPVKEKKRPLRYRFFTYLVFDFEGRTYIARRDGNDIWREMYEFPLIEHESLPELSELGREISEFTDLGSMDFQITAISEIRKHQLSHQQIHARFVKIKILKNTYKGKADWKNVNFVSVADYPLPRLIDKYLETTG